MGVIATCLVTVTLDSLEVLGIETEIGADLVTDLPLPEDGGNVEIDLEPLLGIDETLTVPCPSVDFEAEVGISPLLTANLVIQVAEIV